MPPAARGAPFEKTAPLDPPQKLFINSTITDSLIYSIYRYDVWLVLHNLTEMHI